MSPRALGRSAHALIVSSSPDVCKTPMGGCMVDVPYTITRTFDIAENTVSRVRYQGDPAFTIESYLPSVKGNEPGTGGGLRSGVNEGCCRAVEHSSTVRAGKKWIVRHGDLMRMNTAGPEGGENTFGRVVFGAVENVVAEDPALTDPNTVSLESRTSSYTDDQGRIVEEHESTLETRDGKVTRSYQKSITDPSTGEVQVWEGTAVSDPATGTTSYTWHEGRYAPATGNYDFRVRQGTVPTPGDGLSSIQITMPRTYDGIPIDGGTPMLAAAPPGLGTAGGATGDAVAAAIQEELDQLRADLALQLVQAGLDVAGIFDPTGATDIASGVLALTQGDWVGAGLSFLSAIPFADILTKSAKGARVLAKIERLRAQIQQLERSLGSVSSIIEDGAKYMDEAGAAAGKKADDVVEEAAEAKKAAAGGGGAEEPPPPPKAESTGGHVPRRYSGYKRLQDCPNYPADFKQAKMPDARVPINNKEKWGPILEEIEPNGGWVKVYRNGMAGGKRVSLHFFQSYKGTVVNLDVKDTWSTIYGYWPP